MDDTKDLSEPVDKSPADDESKSAISADLIRGHINTIILRTLYERDKYGYEIIEEIEKKSHGQYSLKQPTLYSALKRLESQDYINAYWKTDEVSLGGRRKYYTLTDSGREIAERNQAEWEYSRTVIDNLISDRSFDFSQPAPASVDFKILKKSTSRVPVVKDGDQDEDGSDENEEALKEERPIKTKEELPEIEIKPETVTYTEQTVYYETAVPPPTSHAEKNADAHDKQIEPQRFESAQEKIVREEPLMNEEQRRIVHENYMRLISEPVAEPLEKEPDVVPVADDIDTEKLIYNNKPETERDYRNLINNLFVRTIKQTPKPEPEETRKPAHTVKIDDIKAKADSDGLKVNSSEYVISTRKKSYNRGGTLFKSSLMVNAVLLLVFMLSLIFRAKLGVTLAYPFVIFAIDVAQLLIFGVFYYTELGKNSRKPISTVYLSACIIVTVILILIIFIVSILLNVNFSSAGDIFAKIIIPCIVALNIPLFAGCCYAFSKNN